VPDAEGVSTTARLVGRIVAPLVNTNEPEAEVIELNVLPSAPVARGDVVCVLETSKATMAVESEHDGWVGEVHVALHDRITAGDPICEVFDAVPPPSASPARAPAADSAGAGARPRLTRKAEAMARAAGIDLSTLPTDRFVTERDILALVGPARPAPAGLDETLLARIRPNSVVIFGGGGLARDLIDSMRTRHELEALCVVDDRLEPGQDVLGVPVVGGRDRLEALVEAGVRLAVNAVGGIGAIQVRIDIFEALERAGLQLATLVDRGAMVAPSATLAPGAQLFPGAVVSSGAVIGRGALINTGAIVSHDCRIGDYSHVAPGAILAGDVTVGEATLIGMGVTATLGCRIGSRCIVGNGAAVTADVPDRAIVSAGSVWPPPGSGAARGGRA
jgi:sugar O-acyltransferase (sialic acid O-acetyltransferase NeuD family)